MTSKINGKTIEFSVEGAISEKSSLFATFLNNFEDIRINLGKATFINSIGVKNWIEWIGRAPKNARFTLEECPYVIVHQTNIVHGFLPANGKITSFLAPYLCDNCSYEQIIKLSEGTHYTYGTDVTDPTLNTPKGIACPKCKGTMEPDFLEQNTFKFLKLK